MQDYDLAGRLKSTKKQLLLKKRTNFREGEGRPSHHLHLEVTPVFAWQNAFCCVFVSYRNLKSKQLGHFRRMGILSSQYYSYHRIEALSCVKIVSQSSEIDVARGNYYPSLGSFLTIFRRPSQLRLGASNSLIVGEVEEEKLAF